LGTETVYCVTQPSHHTFIADGFVSGNCGEQPLPPVSNCLLGSMILCSYVKNPFTKDVIFDWDSFENDVRIAARLLDNVIEYSNLPLKELEENLFRTRRHGMGFTGLGSALNMLGIRYGSKKALEFTEEISKTLAQQNMLVGIELAKEKGVAPVFSDFESRKLFLESNYNKRLLDSFGSKKEQIINDIMEYGIRWSHATSIAPVGTGSAVWGNNCSNGLEPVFMNSYLRNIRLPGKKTKTQVEVLDYSYFVWKELNGNSPLPEYWTTTDDLKVEDHINMQAVIQKYVDSATSKTINIPTEYPYEDFKNVYFEGWKKGLKGITTYRFIPEVTTGVLVRKEELENTKIIFRLEGGEEIEVRGSDIIEYDGEEHVAANLYEALKEGLYGKM
jgi:ribonucleoside-diphosphate reductase alpha chain